MIQLVRLMEDPIVHKLITNGRLSEDEQWAVLTYIGIVES